MYEETTYWTAEKVAVDDDEGRFILDISTDEGERLTINIHNIDLDAFYDQVKGRIGPYLQEMNAARSAVAAGVTREAFIRASEAVIERGFACSPEDVDESGGYDTSDPKHPDFHSIHADLYDQRAGK